MFTICLAIYILFEISQHNWEETWPVDPEATLLITKL